MYITWLGQDCVKVETKVRGQDVVMLFDPYRPTQEDFPRSFTPDIVLCTHGTNNLVTLSKDPFIVTSPGEYERNSALIYGIDFSNETKKPTDAPEVIYRTEVEGVALCFLGNLHRPLSEEELTSLEAVDIVFVPIGGGTVLDGAQAAHLITRLEPRVVIPIDFKTHGTGAAFAGPEAFLKAMGKGGIVPQERYKITKKELPTEEMITVLLQKYARE